MIKKELNILTFEQLLSTRVMSRPARMEQPTLRDMIFDYYCGVFKDCDKANAATKEYTDELARIFVK